MPQCLISGWVQAETWWQWGGGKVCFPALFLQWWGFLHHNYGTYFASIGLKLPMKWSLLLALTEVSCCSVKWTTIKWMPFTMLKLSTCIHVSYNIYTILSILINLPIMILTYFAYLKTEYIQGYLAGRFPYLHRMKVTFTSKFIYPTQKKYSSALFFAIFAIWGSLF